MRSARASQVKATQAAMRRGLPANMLKRFAPIGGVVAAVAPMSSSALCLARTDALQIRYVEVKHDGIEPQYACGNFKWQVNDAVMIGGGFECWEDEVGAPCVTQYKRVVLTGDGVLWASDRLSNEDQLHWTIGSPALTPISASAEREGWLRYSPPPPGVIPKNQRLKMRSEAEVTLLIHLNRGGNLIGIMGDKSSSGGGKAAIETVGEGFGVGSPNSIQEALSDPIESRASVLQPGATWATNMVSTQLGFGFSFGAESGGSVEVGWSAGGDLAVQDISETMVCVGWDCVGGDQPWSKVYSQEAAVFAKAGLVDGLLARVDAKVIFKHFELAAMLNGEQCEECPLEPGYQSPVAVPPAP